MPRPIDIGAGISSQQLRCAVPVGPCEASGCPGGRSVERCDQNPERDEQRQDEFLDGAVCWLAGTCTECGALIEGGTCWNCGARRVEEWTASTFDPEDLT